MGGSKGLNVQKQNTVFSKGLILFFVDTLKLSSWHSMLNVGGLLPHAVV